MDRVIASAASSSAEQPATWKDLQMVSIHDVQRWLAYEHIASCSSADVQRIREAAAVLSHPKPRQEDVRPLQGKWEVAQKKKQKPRPLSEVLQEFKDKVIQAAQELQQQLQVGDNEQLPTKAMQV